MVSKLAPSLSDAAWLVVYPCVYAALALLLLRRLTRFNASTWLDGVLSALAVAAIGVASVLPSVLQSTGWGFSVMAVNLAYPILHLLMVASETALRRLGEAGCDLAQGYHIARPQPAEKLTPWLHQNQAQTVALRTSGLRP